MKTCSKAVIFGVVAILCQACSKSESTAGTNQSPNTRSRSARNKSVWTADENTYQGEFDTNGLASVLWIRNRSFLAEGEQPSPACLVSVINTSTNRFLWCWKGAEPNYLKIELLNSEGKPVEKTAEGLKYGQFPTEQQLEAFFKGGRKPVHLKGYAFILPRELGGYTLGSFSIPELFKVTQPGEYTLRVQFRLAQREEKEKKLRRLIWPPEVTAKIRIHPRDPVK